MVQNSGLPENSSEHPEEKNVRDIGAAALYNKVAGE